MPLRRSIAIASTLALTSGAGRPVLAQPAEQSVRLVVEAGRPLRVALDHRVVVKHVGDPVTATLVAPVYAYDRIVLPAGTKVRGHVGKLERPSRKTRGTAMLGGSFAPLRRVLLQFDMLALPDGEEIPIRTAATAGTRNVTLRAAGESKPAGPASRAVHDIAHEAGQTVSAIKAPDKMERFKDAAIRSLPYYPDFLSKGTVYSAPLLAQLDFGEAVPTERAPPGTKPAPESILQARLVTPIDSATSRPETPMEAVITEPVFSADHRLILPAGARLTGAVTYARPARRFRRNGQLRFLFEAVHVPDRDAERLPGSLHAAEVSRDDRLAIDEEGGATITNPKARFVAPALAALALAGTLHGRLDYDTDGAPPETEYGGAGSSTIGGFLGFGVVGTTVSLISHPGAVAFGIIGVARTVYGSVFTKGREVVFPADTVIQVQLGPGPAAKKSVSAANK